MNAPIPSPDVYTYTVVWSQDDRGFLATVAEFPSLSWLAASPEDAAISLKGLVHQTLVDLQINGGALPAPLPRPIPVAPPPPPPYAGFPTFPVPAVNQTMNVRVGGGRGFVSTNHTFHLLMTIGTCGMWAPVWIIMSIINGSRNTGRH